MRYQETSFFLTDREYKPTSIHFHIGRDPLLIRVNASDHIYDRPAITIYLENEHQLIEFKNGVLWAYENYIKEKKQNV